MESTISPVDLYNLSVGATAATGIAYLIYRQRVVGVFDRFLSYLLVGFFLFGVGGPIAGVLAPDWAHVAHGTAALFAVFALYNPVHNDLRRDDWARLLFSEPRKVRDRPDWMTPMDDDILELFSSTSIILTPAIIAETLEYSRGEINRHLSRLSEHEYLEKVDRGKYQLTERGKEYLRGM